MKLKDMESASPPSSPQGQVEGYGDLTHGAVRGDEDDGEHLAPHAPHTVGAKQGVGSVDQPGGEITWWVAFKQIIPKTSA